MCPDAMETFVLWLKGEVSPVSPLSLELQNLPNQCYEPVNGLTM